MEESDSQAYIEGLEQELKTQQNKNLELQQGAIASSMFNQNQNDNLIVYQLELDNILERIEHLLKGDIIQTDEEGNVIYVTPDDTSLIILNDYGVKLVMNVISIYLNRNTILSSYNEQRIFEILYDLGIELADLIYINFKVMGMDSIEKRSRYPLLVMSILHTIESTYNRALHGGERESLRSARMVTQSVHDPMVRGSPYAMRSKKFSLFRPGTWTGV